MGVCLHDCERQRELKGAHRGFGLHGDVGICAELHARAGVQRGVSADVDPRVPGDRAHRERQDRLQDTVGDLDGGGVHRVGVDGAARGHVAQDVDLDFAQLQRERVEGVPGGQEGLVQRQAGEQVDHLGGRDACGGGDGDLGSCVRLVKAYFDFDGVLFVQVVLDDALIDLGDRDVGHDGVDQHVLALDVSVDGDFVSGQHQVEGGGDQLVDFQAVAAVRDEVGQEQAAGRNLEDTGGIKVDCAVHVQHVVGERLRRDRGGGGRNLHGVLVSERVGVGVNPGDAHDHLLGKGDRERLGQVAEEADLGQRLDGQFGGVAGDAARGVDLVIELAGQVQPVEPRATRHVHVHARERRERRGGIHADQVIAVAAVKVEGALLKVELIRHVFHQRGDHLAAESQFHAAVGREDVAARAATDGGIDLGEVDREAVGAAGFRGGKRQVGGVDVLDCDLVVAEAAVDLDGKHVGRNHAGDRVIDVAQEGLDRGQEIRRKVGDLGEVEGLQRLEQRRGVLAHLRGDGHAGRDGRRLLDLDGRLIIPCAQVHLDFGLDVFSRDVHVVGLLGAVVGKAVRVADRDHRAGGEVQPRQHHVQAADVDRAVHLHAARGIGGDVAGAVQRVLGDDSQRDLFGGVGAAEDGQDQIAQRRTGRSVQVDAVVVGAVCDHDGRGLVDGVPRRGQRILQRVLDGVAGLGVFVGEKACRLFDVRAAGGDHVGLDRVLRAGGFGSALRIDTGRQVCGQRHHLCAALRCYLRIGIIGQIARIV